MERTERPVCGHCGTLDFEDGGYGVSFCLRCGVGKPGPITSEMAQPFFRADRVLPKQCYPRMKRFKKYLSRAMRAQSANTVPEQTWQYLLEHGPYRDAKHVQSTLKRARHLKRKCYDSLPYLTAALCPHIKVPVLNEGEKATALQMFSRIDRAIQSGPFVSYLYCLEYILLRLDRRDMCAHINRIQCPKRRATYKARLDEIFGKPEATSIEMMLKRQSRTPA